MKVLICPLCSLPLSKNPQGLACSNRHQFDQAKEGYFNLLPVHHKNSLEPGDAKQQLIARRDFLEAGYFLPLVDALKKIISPNVTNVLDIGCGEGYFTQSLLEHCASADVYGLDISKAGVRLAARRAEKRMTCVVASSHSLPFEAESMDAIVRIYAPSKDQELLRVLTPSGRLVIVTPGEQHLLGLRQKIYQVIRPHPKPLVPEGFEEVSQDSVCFPLEVPAGDLTASLLAMTPFAWKLRSDLLSAYIKEGVADWSHFQIGVYRKL